MRERLLADPARSEADRELLRSLEARVDGADDMWRAESDLYLATGLSAIHLIDEALGATGSAEPGSILDLPCGYGRVLRFLRARFRGAEIVASDIHSGGVRFCERRLGAVPHPSSEELDQVEFGRRFELIFCGSLATHLGERDLGALLALIERSLSPRGLAILTTNGSSLAEAPDDNLTGALREGAAAGLVAAFERDGFGFEPYERRGSSGRYGSTLVSRPWLRERAGALGLRQAWLGERAWLGYQDAIALAH